MKRTVVLGPIIALTLLAGGAAAQLPTHHAHANLPIHTSKSATTKLADGGIGVGLTISLSLPSLEGPPTCC